jgi:plastocyanin
VTTSATRRLAATGAVLATLGSLGIVAAAGSPRSEGDAPLGPGRATTTIDIEHSRFSTDRIVVAAGTLVTFVVDNDDPIAHELIVGPPEVHRRHATRRDFVVERVASKFRPVA